MTKNGKNGNDKFIDLVIAGPDFSGTSTQVEDLIKYFQKKEYKVRDIRGTEFEALFHAEKFSNFNQNAISLETATGHYTHLNDIILDMANMIRGVGYNKPRVASMVKNNISEYINPDSADVWIMEEPTYRGAGQIIRTIETNRGQFNSETDQMSVTLSFQPDRTSEFLRFRKPLRDAGKIIIRSRSEESACYQMYDSRFIPNGPRHIDYIQMPGHKLAFAHPPTDIFVVCGPQNWDPKDYAALKAQRLGSSQRQQDEFEKNAPYQLLINERYATDWLENLYKSACPAYDAKAPKIHRFDIRDSKEDIKKQMYKQVDKILEKKLESSK